MASLKTITQFKSRLAGGGARPNLFEVNINDFKYADNWDNETFQFLCKTAALPASSITPVEIPFRGRILKVAGDRTFEHWSVTVINDESFDLRESFERWQELIKGIESGNGSVTPSEYMGSGIIRQLGRTNIGRRDPGTGGAAGSGGDVLYTYKVEDCWPSEI